jgi:glutathione peroxidase-family protein
MDKCDVNGPDAHEVFQYLRANTKELISKRDPNQMLKLPWNFCRWVVDKDGRV